MLLSMQEAQEAHEKFNSSTLEELNILSDELSDAQVNFSATLSADQTLALKTFIDLVPQNPGFGLAILAVDAYDKLVEGAETVFDVTNVRVVQKLLVDSKPVNIVHMRAAKNAINALQETNNRLGRIEETHRLMSTYIVNKEQELATGLEFSQEDKDNRAPLGPTYMKKVEKTKAEKTKVEKPAIEVADKK